MSSGSTQLVEGSAGPSETAFSLANILGEDHENVEHPTVATEAHATPAGWDEEAGVEQVAQGFCVECEGALRGNPMSGRGEHRGCC